MDFAILAVVIAAGVWVANMFSARVMATLPASFATNQYIPILVNGVLIAGAVVMASKIHGKIGTGIRAAV